MPKMNALAAAALVLAAVGASPARAQVAAPPAGAGAPAAPAQRLTQAEIAAREPLMLFSRMCLLSGGHRTEVEPVLDRMPPEAQVRRMPVDRVARIQGKDGGAGWTMTSPNGTVASLDFTVDGPCSVRLAKADAAAMEAGVARLMEELVRDGKSTFSKSLDERVQAGGGELHRVEYLLQAQGQDAAVTIGVATTAAAGAEHQAVLTFQGPRARN